MKTRLKVVGLLAMFLLPAFADATYQIADSSRGVLAAKGKHYTGYPNRYADRVTFQLFKGSLKDNVQRVAQQHGWQVDWQIRQRYPVLIETQIAGPDFVTVMNDLLRHYPVSVTYEFHFKHGAHRMTVSPEV
ncbi:MAG: hypothetical protein CMF39_01200 [Legionellaceae bacterium]|nr:hypothetical protein [Legionellaceae bacterium]|tara:strand:- start:2323 stop:2718 length:396 start_codon:yes stop_codon:yes gene_type:complete